MLFLSMGWKLVYGFSADFGKFGISIFVQIIKDQYAMGGRFLMESPGLMMTRPHSVSRAHVQRIVSCRQFWRQGPGLARCWSWVSLCHLGLSCKLLFCQNRVSCWNQLSKEFHWSDHNLKMPLLAWFLEMSRYSKAQGHNSSTTAFYLSFAILANSSSSAELV